MVTVTELEKELVVSDENVLFVSRQVMEENEEAYRLLADENFN